MEEDFDEKINFFDVDFIKIKDSTNGQAESASLLVKEIKNFDKEQQIIKK